MIETEWLKTNTATAMIEYVAFPERARKLRLFACSACRRIWDAMPHEECHTAVEVSERYADGEANQIELRIVEIEAQIRAEAAERKHSPGWHAARTATFAANADSRAAAERAAKLAADADLVREHFGNPFHPSALSASALTWQDNTVVRLAQAVYDERFLPAGTLDNTRQLILADALEEAGCTDEQILTHLRSGGAHYRGCWVIDLLLGKN